MFNYENNSDADKIGRYRENTAEIPFARGKLNPNGDFLYLTFFWLAEKRVWHTDTRMLEETATFPSYF